MRNAYALLGLSFLIVFVGAYVVIERANAPTHEDTTALPEVAPDYEPANQGTIMLTLTSPAFEEGGKIPSKYTCDGDNVNPELRIEGAPPLTKSFVLVMDDPDIPQSVKDERGIEKFDHWVLYNMAPTSTLIMENSSAGTGGQNSRGATGYVGPCPPDREHRYIYRVYALDGMLEFKETPTLDEVEAAAKEKAIATAILMGRYERTSR